MTRRLHRYSLLVALACAAIGRASEPGVVELEEFITTETALAEPGGVLPTSRPFFSFFGEQPVLDVPRSVTVLTPELMERENLQSFRDLGRIGAGTQQINYYGVPGAPSLRGTRAAVFFDGMQRAFQRNEMPLSFGSLEAIDVVKGPAPAQFGASLPGGYVNLVPKSPYFDRRRGSLRLELGAYDAWRAQLDLGGPLLLAQRPAAFRVSITGQLADSYYDRIGNDYLSLYGALKMRTAADVTLFTGAEYFRFKSNENAGWNRPTQRLIDAGEYVVGEPLSIVSPAWGGVADRTLLAVNPALVVPAEVVATAVAGGGISAVQRDALLDLSDPAGRAAAYGAFTSAQQASIAPATSGYLYTPAYFAAGGSVFTRKIEGSTVLSDERDYADSENVLYFLELERAPGDGAALKGQFLLDRIATEKLSSYGYAINTRQLVLEAKATAARELPVGRGMRLTYGASARFTDAEMLQDFSVEPFSRRDITQPLVSPNSVILSGPQRGPDGKNFWSATAQGGANAHSKLWQFSGFAFAANRITDAVSSYTSLLVAHAPYETQYPDDVDLVPPADPRREPVRDARDYYSASFSPVIRVAEQVNLYGTFQYGTSLDPLQGGAIVGRGNFARSQLVEAGAKSALFEGRLYAALAAFSWRQTRFDDRTNNAEPLRGRGVELEATFAPGEKFSLTGSLGWQRVWRLSDLGFRAMPLSEQQIALFGGVLNNQFGPAIFNPAAGRRPALNPALIYPGTPETQAKLLAIVELGRGFGISGGPIWSAGYWHNFDHTLRLPSSLVWNGSLFYRGGRFDAALWVENISGEDYFLGAEPVFGANTLLTKAPGRNARFSVTLKY